MEDFDAARELGILVPQQPPQTKPRVAFITYFNERYERLAEVSLPNFDRYCKRHSYDLFQGNYHTDASDLKSYGDRGKIAMFNQVYDNHDIVMFLDIDALVMNQSIRIEDQLHGLPFLWTYDVNGPCSGFWIARCIPEVYLMLNTVRNRAPNQGNVRPIYDHGPPAKTVLEMEPTGQSDQQTMRAMMHEPPYSGVLRWCLAGNDVGHCYPREVMKWPKEFPNLNDYAPGDWLVTFPAVPLAERVKLMRRYAEEAQ